MNLKKLVRDEKAEIARLLHHARFELGVQKRTKLAKCIGERARSSLLDNNVAKKHAGKLLQKFTSRWGKFSKRDEKKRLRFLTVLGGVCAVDARSISQGVGKLERDLVRCLKRSGVGLEIIGAVEIEIVNMDVLAGIAAVDNANEQRKLNVVKSLIGEKDPSGSYALVHLHAMVDLGAGAGDNEQMLSGALRDQFPGNYRIELKQTFGSKSIGDNLRHISAYMTKGGNDDLRYGASFGRGSNVAEALEHQIWREGGAGDKRRSASDDVSVEDSRSLSIAEVKVLGEAVDDLMARKRDRTGYIFRYGTRQK